VVVPGRNAIAQGLSNVATSALANGGFVAGRLAGPAELAEAPDPCASWALVGADAPHAASASKALAVINRIAMHAPRC
jgi:hypothetical protein